MNPIAAVEELAESGDWPAARRVLAAALQATPSDHWMRSRVGVTYYETGDYSAALRHIEKAREIAPNCPIVLWDLAGTLQRLGRHGEALAIYEKLVRRKIGGLATDSCVRGRALAKGFIADCHLRLSDSLRAVGRAAEAEAACDAHFDMRGPGCYSIYSLKKFPGPGAVLPLWRRKAQQRREAQSTMSH